MQRLAAKRLISSKPAVSIIRCTGSHNLLTSPANSGDIRDPQTLCRTLETCKLSMNFQAVLQTHTRAIVFGYGTYPSVIASLLSTYVCCDSLYLARRLLDQISVRDFHIVTLNLVIESLMTKGECDIAKKVFHSMHVRDIVTWNSMVGGYVKNGQFEEAFRLFQKMLSSNIEPDKFTFASIISGCARLGALDRALWVYGLMIEKRIELNAILISAVIDMYSKCGRIQTAKDIFESVPRNDVCIWNAMINGLAIHGFGLDAILVFSKMEVENIFPDYITFIGLLTACSHCGLVEEGQKYFDLMTSRYSIQPRLEHYGAMVDLFSRAGLLDEAYLMVEAMPMEPDNVIWRTILSACRIHKKPKLGEAAIENISHPKSGDYVLLSNMYCSLKRWNSAERVREMMKKSRVRKLRAKSWFEIGGVIHQFKSGDRSHPETEALYKVLEGLIQRTRLEGFTPATELVMMDVSEEEKEGNLFHHCEKLALAYGILKTSPGTEVRVSSNLRICHDCHCWMKMVSKLLSRVVIVRDRIRFHRFEGGFCSCADYW
ncbi:pentatricopeptide repeat-containing protein At5g50990 [Tripterygium wilfordii]|uniref:pentatricopeptide repeat-containing protein At5g50990 n=1 Tax=Tripterygium wilfordii TaxID=458696 RepID=UPI0018F7FA46|nr:pentatricopeptide repeat-containing protein At5g50990 [Tripterygium wilfordii]XP_038683773.1 pentatricopeptide repeat-containing protein At5g50990 [Tripterygium wilfordii]